MKNNKIVTPSQDGSPFDLPKSYIYKSITDYHVNKVLQLIKVKNFDLALIELDGLSESAKTLNQEKEYEKFQNLLNETESKVQKRNQLREFYHTKFLNTENKFDILDEFIFKARDLEEYNSLQNRILKHYNSKNITDIIFSFDSLKYLSELGKLENQKGLSPFILFDLDSTLFDNSPRVYKIIQDFIEEHRDIYPEHTEKMSYIRRQDIVWGIKENLKKINVHDEELVNKVIRYWYERFFSNDYIIDVPLSGSCQFVKDLESSGVKIVYLTGRFESMREGTEKNLLEHGFPLYENGENLVLKPNPKISDEEFKHQSMESMRKFGDMLAGFENEPINSNIFQEHYPEADIFFLETNHSLNPPNLNEKIHTIKNFCYLN
ncbi:MAG: HAD family hydrolase [Candidatus Sericytochromatia bacterium]